MPIIKVNESTQNKESNGTSDNDTLDDRYQAGDMKDDDEEDDEDCYDYEDYFFRFGRALLYYEKQQKIKEANEKWLSEPFLEKKSPSKVKFSEVINYVDPPKSDEEEREDNNYNADEDFEIFTNRLFNEIMSDLRQLSNGLETVREDKLNNESNNKISCTENSSTLTANEITNTNSVDKEIPNEVTKPLDETISNNNGIIVKHVKKKSSLKKLSQKKEKVESFSSECSGNKTSPSDNIHKTDYEAKTQYELHNVQNSEQTSVIQNNENEQHNQMTENLNCQNKLYNMPHNFFLDLNIRNGEFEIEKNLNITAEDNLDNIRRQTDESLNKNSSLKSKSKRNLKKIKNISDQSAINHSQLNSKFNGPKQCEASFINKIKNKNNCHDISVKKNIENDLGIPSENKSKFYVKSIFLNNQNEDVLNISNDSFNKGTKSKEKKLVVCTNNNTQLDETSDNLNKQNKVLKISKNNSMLSTNIERSVRKSKNKVFLSAKDKTHNIKTDIQNDKSFNIRKKKSLLKTNDNRGLNKNKNKFVVTTTEKLIHDSKSVNLDKIDDEPIRTLNKNSTLDTSIKQRSKKIKKINVLAGDDALKKIKLCKMSKESSKRTKNYLISESSEQIIQTDISTDTLSKFSSSQIAIDGNDQQSLKILNKPEITRKTSALKHSTLSSNKKSKLYKNQAVMKQSNEDMNKLNMSSVNEKKVISKNVTQLHVQPKVLREQRKDNSSKQILVPTKEIKNKLTESKKISTTVVNTPSIVKLKGNFLRKTDQNQTFNTREELSKTVNRGEKPQQICALKLAKHNLKSGFILNTDKKSINNIAPIGKKTNKAEPSLVFSETDSYCSYMNL